MNNNNEELSSSVTSMSGGGGGGSSGSKETRPQEENQEAEPSAAVADDDNNEEETIIPDDHYTRSELYGYWKSMVTSLVKATSKADKAMLERLNAVPGGATTTTADRETDQHIVDFFKYRHMWENRVLPGLQADLQGQAQELQIMEHFVQTISSTTNLP